MLEAEPPAVEVTHQARIGLNTSPDVEPAQGPVLFELESKAGDTRLPGSAICHSASAVGLDQPSSIWRSGSVTPRFSLSLLLLNSPLGGCCSTTISLNPCPSKTLRGTGGILQQYALPWDTDIGRQRWG
ncbi:hypothetical protein NL676_025764 [Syzygium grande]|nr:hypothetical protein NL676_025764 [Syzygium grande]